LHSKLLSHKIKTWEAHFQNYKVRPRNPFPQKATTSLDKTAEVILVPWKPSKSPSRAYKMKMREGKLAGSPGAGDNPLSGHVQKRTHLTLIILT
jgi:hypothetical protein